MSRGDRDAPRRANGEGTIYQLGEDGPWVAALTFPNGTRPTRTRKTYADAKRALAELRELRKSGVKPESVRLSLGEYLDEWLAARRHKVKPNTIWYYENRIAHIKKYLGTRKLGRLRPLDFDGMYSRLRVDDNQADRSIHSIHTTLKVALSDAVRSRILQWHPMDGMKAPSFEAREPQTLTGAQVGALLRTARQRDPEMTVLFTVLVKLGLRISEALALRWSDIDWARHELTVRQQLIRLKGGAEEFAPLKTKASRRTIELNDAMIALFRTHHIAEIERRRTLPPQTPLNAGLLFVNKDGKPYNRTGIGTRLTRLCKTARLPRATPHGLRHTCATLLLMGGEQSRVVQERLGHSSITTTLSQYGHVMPGRQKSAGDMLDELIGE